MKGKQVPAASAPRPYAGPTQTTPIPPGPALVPTAGTPHPQAGRTPITPSPEQMKGGKNAMKGRCEFFKGGKGNGGNHKGTHSDGGKRNGLGSCFWAGHNAWCQTDATWMWFGWRNKAIAVCEACYSHFSHLEQSNVSRAMD